MNNLPIHEQAEALDLFLDKLQDHAGAAAPEALAQDTAIVARLLGHQQPPLTHATRERIWSKALKDAQRPRRITLAGAFPVGIAAIIAISLVFVALYRPTQPSVQAASSTPAPAMLAYPMFSYEGVIEQTEKGTTFQTHAWYQSPDHYRYEDYLGVTGSGTSDMATQVNNADSATAVKSASQSTAVASDGSTPNLYEIEVNDGQRHWLYDASQNAVYEPRPGETAWINRFSSIPVWYPGSTSDPDAALKAVLALLQRSYAGATFQSATTFATRPAWIIEVTPPSDRFDNPNTAAQTVKRRLWIDQQTYLQLNQEDYDSAGQVLLRYGFDSLTVNPTIDPALFRLNLPESSWQNPSWKQLVDVTAFDWHVAAASAPFPAYRPSSIMLSNFDILVGAATYDPFTNALTQQGYASKDPYGPAVLRITESALKSIAPDGANTQTVPLGSTQLVGTAWQQNGINFLVFPFNTTWITLQSASLYPQQITAIAASFTYAAPYLGSNDLTALWNGIRSRVAYPLYVASSYDDTQGVVSRATGGEYGVLPGKLALGQPTFNGDAVTQPLYYSDKPGVAGLIMEMPAAHLIVPGNATPQKVGDYNGYYHEDDQYRYLDIMIDQTAITLKTQKDVSQSTLTTLASSLQGLGK